MWRINAIIQFMLINVREINKMANMARKLAPSARAGRTPPRQPDYPDEVSKEQLEAIRLLTDPNGDRANQRTVLHSAGW